MNYTKQQRQNLWDITEQINNLPYHNGEMSCMDLINEITAEGNGYTHTERVKAINEILLMGTINGLNLTPKFLELTLDIIETLNDPQ